MEERVLSNRSNRAERACEVVGRDFTDEEWDRLVPGDVALQSACA